VFLKCTAQGGRKVDVLLTAFLQLWLKFRAGIDYPNFGPDWIVPVRKLFYFHHCSHLVMAQQRSEKPDSRKSEQAIVSAAFVQVILDEVESFVLKEHREKVLIFTCK